MLVIAHRGAPVYTAESTIDSFQAAADLGADLVESDLVMTKDGQLMLFHDLELSRVTDIASRPEFATRRTIRNFNGVDYEGWWVDEFTAAELKTLRKPGDRQIASLEEALDFSGGRGISMYLEVKESAYFQGRGLDPIPPLVAALARRGLTGRESGVWLQSFSEADLRALRGRVGNRLVYLTREVSPEQVALFPTYRQFADVLAVPTTRARRQLVTEAHAADLGVHIWILRGSRDAYRKAASIGADGVITDFPDLGVDVRGRLRSSDRPAGLSARVDNGNAVATWTADGTSWYAVTFDFGDPLLAPTIWTNQGSASVPMADATSVDVTVARYSGRLGSDAFARAQVTPSAFGAPTVRTRVAEVEAIVTPDARIRIQGRLEQLKGSKWVPLRRAQAWLLGRGEDVAEVRRSFRTGKKGDFQLFVQVKEDVISGYLPQRSWRVGVTPTSTYKPSVSNWVDSVEGPPPKPAGPRKARSLQKKDVRIRRR
jgi:glycerophosphoryl diester phosphodiesterase